MNFLIISHVIHKTHQNEYYGYGPYIKEMNIWLKHVDKVTIVAPISMGTSPDLIDLPYQHSNIQFIEVPEINFLTWPSRIKAVFQVPLINFKLIQAMAKADHIHLRCPGNMGLLGCIVQVLFPRKIKSAKYAGNWDPASIQPYTYTLQKKILKNQFLTRNIKTLVYGKWEENNKNILPFFTASYAANEIKQTETRPISPELPIQMIFVGSLEKWKNPLLSVETCKLLNENQQSAVLHLYGEGSERPSIERYITDHNLQDNVFLHGNVPGNMVKQAFQKSHFLIFISESEGWPKVVAEAMFWGCLPLTTPVSCVPEMVGYGKRGDLIGKDVNEVVELIRNYISQPETYHQKSRVAMDWSRQFTLEEFENEIKKIIK